MFLCLQATLWICESELVVETQTQGALALSNSAMEIKNTREDMYPPVEKKPQRNLGNCVPLPSRESIEGGVVRHHPFKDSTSSLQ